MADIMLYTNPMSRGRIARWMLEEVGVPYDVTIMKYGPQGVGSADYRAINPMGKVPAIRHGGQVVTEAAAICAYLADAFPEAGLAPAPKDRAAYYRWMFFAAGPVEAATTARALQWEVPAEREPMAGFGTYERTIDALEMAVSDTPYVAGDSFTAADVYVGSAVTWGLRFGTIGKRPAFEAYAQRLAGREAARRANELDDSAASDLAAE